MRTTHTTRNKCTLLLQSHNLFARSLFNQTLAKLALAVSLSIASSWLCTVAFDSSRPHGVSLSMPCTHWQCSCSADKSVNHVWRWVTARLFGTHTLIRCITTVRTARGRAEQGPSGSSGVVVGHVRRVVDGHPPGRRDGLGSGLLAVSGHLLSDIMD